MKYYKNLPERVVQVSIKWPMGCIPVSLVYVLNVLNIAKYGEDKFAVTLCLFCL